MEVRGIDLVMIDADTAGCISTFLSRDRTLDTWRLAILGLCYRNLSVVVGELDGGARVYFSRLENLAGLVLRAIAAKGERD